MPASQHAEPGVELDWSDFHRRGHRQLDAPARPDALESGACVLFQAAPRLESDVSERFRTLTWVIARFPLLRSCVE